MTKDYLIDCPLCGEKGACYAINANEDAKNYLCLGCGYQGSDFLIDKHYDRETYEEEYPQLYRDLRRVDSEGRAWYPTSINIEEKGTIFANGTSVEDWQWSAIKTIPLTEQEMDNQRFKGKSYKSDSSSLKHFGSDFLSALEYLDIEI